MWFLNGVKVKIVDESGQEVGQGEVGEILVQAETVMKGYWKHEQQTADTFSSDGWLKTGDLGHMDAQGRLYISAGRKKDLIIRAGENVSPLTIENGRSTTCRIGSIINDSTERKVSR